MIKITIIGRPNTGKSTLFNRLCPSNLISKALVTDTEGYTRDRKDTITYINDIPVILTDTAGFEAYAPGSIQEEMINQTTRATDHADLCLFLIDGKSGMLPIDKDYAQMIRKKNIPTISVVNKCENRDSHPHIYEAYNLGFGEAIGISAQHGIDIDLLKDKIEKIIEKFDIDTKELDNSLEIRENEILRIAIIGRPNAGKSSLINALIDNDRLIVSSEAGSTRDSIEIQFNHKEKSIFLYDTAGLRKKSHIKKRDEKLSIDDAFNAIRYAHVVILLMDYANAMELQDLTLANYIKNEGRCLVFAFSKCDLMDNASKVKAQLHDQLHYSLPDWKNSSSIFVSSKTGEGVEEVLDMCMNLYDKWQLRIPTAQLNQWLEKTLLYYPPPMHAGRRVKIRYITQIKARPPSFVLFCSQTDGIKKAYKRYLVNNLIETFGFNNVPIRLKFKSSKNPYAQ